MKSRWKSINAGVPQGTKLGPLFFLVMIKDLSPSLPIYKYIDDCTILEVVTAACATSTLQKEVDQINEWTVTNNMRPNTKKTKELTICFAKSQVSLDPVVVNNQQLESIQSVKLLGVHIKRDLKWDLHVDSVFSKANERLYALRTTRKLPGTQDCLDDLAFNII